MCRVLHTSACDVDVDEWRRSGTLGWTQRTTARIKVAKAPEDGQCMNTEKQKQKNELKTMS
jgi:hypothetical protein